MLNPNSDSLNCDLVDQGARLSNCVNKHLKEIPLHLLNTLNKRK